MAAGKLTPAFLDHPLFRWSGRTAETYRDLAARLGLPMAPLRRGYEAAGFAPPEPDELVREDDLDLIPTIHAAVAAGIDEDATVRALRVFGDSLRGTVALSRNGPGKPSKVEALLHGRTPRKDRTTRPCHDLSSLGGEVEAVARG